MGMLDDLATLRATRKRLAELVWSMSKAEPRLFEPDSGSSTREVDAPHSLIANAMCVVEHEFSSEISYCASYQMGNALKVVVLRYLDKQIRALAPKVAEEARAALALAEDPRP